MSRKIIIEFPDANIKCTAKLLDKEEPEMCDRFWDALEKPLKMIGQHTLSTGDWCSGFPRPPKHYVKVGSQANPIGKKRLMLTQIEPGSIVYAVNVLKFAYGPHITEPLLAPGPVVAKVDEECLDNFFKGGRSVWNSHYMTHRLVTIIIRREEE